ncbi:MAG: DNA-3-methyladenine glycosylase [Candidatus Limnocylindrales bacterium]
MIDLPPLPREWFDRPTDVVARDLLGKWLCRRNDDGLICGRIVETEAYGGPDDMASHARAGVTRRTRPMFGEVGHAYVYLIYGMHECLNVVAYKGAQAGAVLLRALEPMVGAELMRRHRVRPTDSEHKLCSGPARLCQAMNVTRALDSHDLTAGESLWLADDPGSELVRQIAEGPRVGVAYAGDDWSRRPLRFWLSGNRSVSRLPR